MVVDFTISKHFYELVQDVIFLQSVLRCQEGNDAHITEEDSGKQGE